MMNLRNIREGLEAVLSAAIWIGLAALAMGSELSAQTPTTSPAVVTHQIKELGLQATCPKAWEVRVTAPTPGSPEPITAVHFGPKDAAGPLPLFVLLRIERMLDANTDPAAYAEKAIAHHRDATLKSGGKVQIDQALTVAGSPGRMLVVDVNGGPMLIVCFVGQGREYKIAVMAEPEGFEAVRLQALDVISSFQWVREQ